MVSLAKAYLERAEETATYNAYIEIYTDELLVQAAALDKKISESPDNLGALFGAVVSIKDNICYRGHLATAGSKILDGFVSPYSATVVERLLAADALIIGRTNCDELSMGSTNETSFYGPAKNALDPTKVPGGSSGGGAVAVALNTCLISIGSDTGGSIRQPAAFNGVLGYKPSYGLISRWGLIAYGSSFDTIGLLGHSATDMISFMKVLAGPDAYDSTALPEPVSFSSGDLSDPSKIRIAYSKRMIEHSRVEEDIRKGTMAYIAQLENAGYELVDIDLDFAEYLVPTYYVLVSAEASSNLSRLDGIRYGHRSTLPTDDYKELIANSRTEGFGREVKKRIMLGTYVLSEGYYDAYFKKAQKVRAVIKARVEEILSSNDFLLMPTTTSSPWPLGQKHRDPLQAYHGDMYTVLANLCGIPAISFAVDNIEQNTSLGIQLMTRTTNDSNLLSIIDQLTLLN